MVAIWRVILMLIPGGSKPIGPYAQSRGYHQKQRLVIYRRIAVIFTLLALSQSAFAADIPSAGSQFQQIPPSPVIQKEVPKIIVEPGIAPAIPESADQVKILVNSTPTYYLAMLWWV